MIAYFVIGGENDVIFPPENYLRLNKIKIIPNEIIKLRNLEELWLSSNNIELIPDSIGELKSLRNRVGEILGLNAFYDDCKI